MVWIRIQKAYQLFGNQSNSFRLEVKMQWLEKCTCMGHEWSKEQLQWWISLSKVLPGHSKIMSSWDKTWEFAVGRGLWLSITHCRGSENTEAERASRVFKDETEWTLEEGIFSSICEYFGQPYIDLFASRLNNKVQRFCSWQQDPEAVFIDIFCMSGLGNLFMHSHHLQFCTGLLKNSN